ncbi:MAG: hypothetical protein E4H36_04315 [Spirochaetales bacterium]|nr:MAG: hypothetical protein E4H36_04315 [Spirochaetales bacterium]
MEDKGIFSGEIDPEIAELIGVEEGEKGSAEAPGFTDLFDEPRGEGAGAEQIDFTAKKFTKIEKFEEAPKPFFNDKNYYKTALSGEGEDAQRVHEYLTKFLKSEDTQDKSMWRSKLIPVYWNVAASISRKIYSKLPMPKLLILRFGALLPTLLSEEQRLMVSKIIFENNTGEPVHYVDEWLKRIAAGEISASATDETKTVQKNENQKVIQKLDKAKGIASTQLGFIKSKVSAMEGQEQLLQEKINFILKHESRPGMPGMKDCYSPDQKSAVNEAVELLKRILNLDKEIGGFYSQYESANSELEELGKMAEEAGVVSEVDSETIVKEFNTARQMAKLCVGKQGNHFPVLMKQYFRSNIRDIGTRENVLAEMAAVEELDPGLFLRTFKRETNRIVPHIIIVPCYGDRGICWEPFERFNRATSRGRVAIPLYPKELKLAILYALADLRWQVAKEKAQHYWMEEGLTGKYYQWFSEKKLKGDVKEYFINDYILWIMKESEGMQKLDKDVRGIFWRMMPFPQNVKEILKNRGFFYAELFKKDQNISLSDGY